MFQNGDDGAFSEPHRPRPVGRDGAADHGRLPGRGPAGHAPRRDRVRPARRRLRPCALALRGQARLRPTRSQQDYDVKTFESDTVPSQRAGRGPLRGRVRGQHRPTPKFDITPYVKDGVYASSTGQLHWKEGASKMDGSFTMDTPGTKAVVGFAEGQTAKLGQVTITPQSRFGADLRHRAGTGRGHRLGQGPAGGGHRPRAQHGREGLPGQPHHRARQAARGHGAGEGDHQD